MRFHQLPKNEQFTPRIDETEPALSNFNIDALDEECSPSACTRWNFSHNSLPTRLHGWTHKTTTDYHTKR